MRASRIDADGSDLKSRTDRRNRPNAHAGSPPAPLRSRAFAAANSSALSAPDACNSASPHVHPRARLPARLTACRGRVWRSSTRRERPRRGSCSRADSSHPMTPVRTAAKEAATPVRTASSFMVPTTSTGARHNLATGTKSPGQVRQQRSERLRSRWLELNGTQSASRSRAALFSVDSDSPRRTSQVAVAERPLKCLSDEMRSVRALGRSRRGRH